MGFSFFCECWLVALFTINQSMIAKDDPRYALLLQVINPPQYLTGKTFRRLGDRFILSERVSPHKACSNNITSTVVLTNILTPIPFVYVYELNITDTFLRISKIQKDIPHKLVTMSLSRTVEMRVIRQAEDKFDPPTLTLTYLWMWCLSESMNDVPIWKPGRLIRIKKLICS